MNMILMLSQNPRPAVCDDLHNSLAGDGWAKSDQFDVLQKTVDNHHYHIVTVNTNIILKIFVTTINHQAQHYRQGQHRNPYDTKLP